MGLLTLPKQLRAKYSNSLAIDEYWQNRCELMAPKRGTQWNGYQSSTGATKEGLDEIEARPENQRYAFTWSELGLQTGCEDIAFLQ